ncbi:hypothetical protein [Streptomyces antarcticus]|uniref:hypothetical protein n=1 Tax=Streptomyces antarcticus TaxID=2996458 RepID=UPI002270232F|nr:MULTISPECIES: hypothetical protein [unclassified Streptomyces]MCY0942341.1 hypothetical protein [Streptomyces sp. H34-AA3]MCZ4080662.1 hypothetical protein [Streptomyces sp. H34-S5]
MPDATRAAFIPADVITPERDITHEHFAPGDRIVVIKGVDDGTLWGDAMTVVTPSWHTPTNEDGWRLRDADGGTRSFITGHPRYLVHLSKSCPDCLIYQRALQDYLVPKFTGSQTVDVGWYSITELGQLVHVADGRGGSR